ncbi:NAD(P)-binding protein [Pholiota conissans]|uniref:NAD(P)-binding protein n=1 Tax=Pholiota conissans TaxID=109636 RepID=A0A9P6CWK8_9AGAR|nr:NAD(P)-binding protein [Pholiota conissans]
MGSSTSEPFVWVITGCSSGIGRELTLAALKRGDKVIATARPESFDKIQDLKEQGAAVLELEVTAHIDELKKVAAEAIGIYGHVDVVMNNAGFLLPGGLEESTTEDMMIQFNTNVFGAMNVTRAFLPYMRARRTGTISFIGSCYGWRPAPFSGIYVASKFALRGMSYTLDEEIAPFGLRSICFDSGCFRTPVLSKLDKTKRWKAVIEDYKETGEAVNAALLAFDGTQKGDPVRGVNVIMDVIKREGVAQGKEVPSGFSLGQDCYETVKESCEKTLESLEAWRQVSMSTDYPDYL